MIRHQGDGKGLHRGQHAIHVFVRKPFHNGYAEELCGETKSVCRPMCSRQPAHTCPLPEFVLMLLEILGV